MAADYDAGEITDRERQAAKNQTKISRNNVRDTMNQLSRQLSNYDLADRQNRDLADVQLQQNSRKTEADRFEAQRDLQNSALGLLGSMGSAMNGSSTGNFMDMLRSRNDKENNTYWAQLQSNQDSVENAYQDSLNQNNIARRDAMQSAEKAIRDIEAEWSANLNNINPNLFKIGAVDNDEKLSSKKAWTPNKVKSTNAQMSGYIRPQFNTVVLPSGDGSSTVTQPRRNTVRSGDYFSRLMNRFNR